MKELNFNELQILIDKRNELQKLIEVKREQQKTVLSEIDYFISYLPKLISYCEQNKLSSNYMHTIGGRDVSITITSTDFLMTEHSWNTKKKSLFSVTPTSIKECIFNYPLTLNSITKNNGELTEDAQWFFENRDFIIDEIQRDLTLSLSMDIKMKENMLNNDVEEEQTFDIVPGSIPSELTIN